MNVVNKQKGFSSLVAIIVVLIVVAGGAYLFTRQSAEAPTTPAASTTLPASDETADWKTYTNDQYGFEFKYPENWVVSPHYYLSKPSEDGERFSILVANGSVIERPSLRFMSVENNNIFRQFPCHLFKKYGLDINDRGSVSIISEKMTEPINYEQGCAQAEGVESVNPRGFEALASLSAYGHFYWFFINFGRGGEDYEPLLKSVISTFRFTDLTTI